jgi:hemerythrin
MALITWNKDLTLNLREIDEQHQKLVAMVNELDQAMRKGLGKRVVGPLLEALIDYAQVHFSTEEALMTEYGYLETPSHQYEHSLFLKQVRAFKADFDRGKTGLPLDLMTFLSDWMKKHITGTDRKYVSLLMAKGLN